MDYTETQMENLNEVPGAQTNPVGLAKALLCAQAAIDKKAENVKVLDLSELSGFTDYFLICSRNFGSPGPGHRRVNRQGDGR